ncbi:hypothetical protein P9112_006074 [Eukaryota sp. TZLM1-RC]
MIGQKEDIYALGVILFELFSGKSALAGLEDAQIIMAKSKGNNPDHGGLPQEIAELINNCWNNDPNKRPNISEIKKVLGNVLFNMIGYETSDFNPELILQQIHSLNVENVE